MLPWIRPKRLPLSWAPGDASPACPSNFGSETSMLKPVVVAVALSLAALPALAQTATQPSTTPSQPSAAAPAPSTAMPKAQADKSQIDKTKKSTTARAKKPTGTDTAHAKAKKP